MSLRGASPATFPTVTTPAERKAPPDELNPAWQKLREGFRRGLRRPWGFEALYALLALGASALIVSLLGRQAGWPVGEAFGNQLLLTQIYAAHLRHFDLFPVWSSSDAYGLGSPVLLYYQKLFFYVSGALYLLLGGSLKASEVLSIAIFLIVGAYGMRVALTTVTTDKLLLTVGSLGFLFTNYVFTDWLVRQDFGELSAMMIVPWLLYWCVNLVKNRRVSYLLIPVMVLLVNAHNAIALISVFTIVITLIWFAAIAGLSGLRAAALRLLVSAGATAVILAPTLIAELRFSAFYDPATKVHAFLGEQISTNLFSFGTYFYDGSWQWLSNSRSPITPQIDFAIWIPIALALLVVGTSWGISRRQGTKSNPLRYFDLAVVGTLLTCAACYLFLQLRISLWVYDLLSPLKVTDYPYRMLTFIVPIGVILVIMIAEALFKSFPTNPIPRLLAVAWLCSLILMSPLTATFRSNYSAIDRLLTGGRGPAVNYHFPPLGLFSTPKYVDYAHFTGLFTFGGALYAEYLPRLYTQTGQETYNDGAVYERLHATRQEAEALSTARCSVVEPRDTPFEALRLTFSVTCNHPTYLALPITFNSYTTIWLKGPGGAERRVPYVHVRTDPRIVIMVPRTGRESLVVDLPTMGGILGL